VSALQKQQRQSLPHQSCCNKKVVRYKRKQKAAFSFDGPAAQHSRHYYMCFTLLRERESASAGTKNINVYVCILSRRSLFPSIHPSSEQARRRLLSLKMKLLYLNYLLSAGETKRPPAPHSRCVNKAPFNLATSAE
jgi:hypothetical protein